jgi:hypothetical protein
MATTIKPTLAETPEVCVQIRHAATAKIERAELISYNVAGVITLAQNHSVSSKAAKAHRRHRTYVFTISHADPVGPSVTTSDMKSQDAMVADHLKTGECP